MQEVANEKATTLSGVNVVAAFKIEGEFEQSQL
jgi:hypothetical protein